MRVPAEEPGQEVKGPGVVEPGGGAFLVGESQHKKRDNDEGILVGWAARVYVNQHQQEREKRDENERGHGTV